MKACGSVEGRKKAKVKVSESVEGRKKVKVKVSGSVEGVKGCLRLHTNAVVTRNWLST